MDFNHFMPTRVISGKNTVSKFDFSKFGKKAILVTGKTGAAKSGALSDVTKSLEKHGIVFTHFDGIEENPSIESCVSAAEEAKRFSADFMIAIGGGSAMDAAKAAAVLATNGYSDPYEIYAAIPRKPLPLIVIGTTSGTGSEVTAVSVITSLNDNGVKCKQSIKSPRMYPICAIVDPQYTYSLPWSITLSTALDVICHATESLYSIKSDIMSIGYASQALEHGWVAIKTAHWQTFVESKKIDSEIRDELSYAAIMAGMAINSTGTCFAHAMSYPLSVEKNVPHGMACAYFLAEFVKRMSGTDEKLDKVFTESIGYGMNEFIEDLGRLLPAPPKLSMDEVERFSALTSKSKSLGNSINPLSKKDVELLYTGFAK